MYPIFIYDNNIFYKQKQEFVNKKELIDIVAKKSVYLDLDVDNSKISAVVDTNLLSS